MKVVLAALLCVTLAGVAVAEKKKPAVNPRDAEFQKLDTNGDGLLNPREFAAGSKAEKPGRAFGKLDKYQSGTISPAKFRSAGQPKSKP